MLENKLLKLAIAYLLIMLIGFIYNKYKKTIDVEEQYSDGELIQKYLLDGSSLTKNNKPIISASSLSNDTSNDSTNNFKYKELYNSLEFSETMSLVKTNFTDPAVSSNSDDPLFLIFR